TTVEFSPAGGWESSPRGYRQPLLASFRASFKPRVDVGTTPTNAARRQSDWLRQVSSAPEAPDRRQAEADSVGKFPWTDDAIRVETGCSRLRFHASSMKRRRPRDHFEFVGVCRRTSEMTLNSDRHFLGMESNGFRELLDRMASWRRQPVQVVARGVVINPCFLRPIER